MFSPNMASVDQAAVSSNTAPSGTRLAAIYAAASKVPWPLLIVLLALVSVLVRFNSHFWLDETFSYWSASAGLRQIYERCIAFPHPMAYSAVIFGLLSLGARSEWIFRLPSLAGVIGACIVLFRFTKRKFDRETAWITVAAFTSINTFRFAAGDARPYGIALFLAVLSTDLLVRFLDRPRYSLALGYGVAAGAVAHFHFLFGAILVVHALYGIYVIAQRRHAPFGPLLVAVLIPVLLDVPVILQYLRFGGNAASHSFAPRPNIRDLVAALVPVIWICAMLALGLVVLLGLDVKWRLRYRAPEVTLAVIWATIPIVALYAIGLLTPASVFVPRYYLSALPGLAICFGIVVSSFGRREAQVTVLAALTCLTALSIGTPHSWRHTVDVGDWGAAAAFVNRDVQKDNALVLIRSQFPESDSKAIEPPQNNGVFPHLAVYPMNARLVPFRNKFTSEEATRVDRVLADLRKSNREQRFLVVSPGGPAPEELLYYIRGALGSGSMPRQLANFDGISVTEFFIGPGPAQPIPAN